MSDDESVAGELQVGGYASGEWLGSPVKPFFGFGFMERRAARLEAEAAELRSRAASLRGAFQTSPGEVRYISPDQLESWAQAEWDYDGDEAA